MHQNENSSRPENRFHTFSNRTVHSMASILDSDMSKGIGQLLREKRIQVPFYQRDYAWKKSQVQELYDDLRKAIDDDREYYFLDHRVF